MAMRGCSLWMVVFGLVACSNGSDPSGTSTTGSQARAGKGGVRSGGAAGATLQGGMGSEVSGVGGEAATGTSAAGSGNAGNAGTGNAGSGNAGTGNAGTGNAGTGNAGSGNAGTGNAGSGNAGGAGLAGQGPTAGTTGAGRAGTGGALAGAAGAPIQLPHGYGPATLTWADAQQAYTDWKAKHLMDCGGGVYRVPWENAKLDATVSEGIGYGMLLTIAHGDKVAFDGLYAYYKMASGGTGLMNWLRYGCDAHYDTKYNAYPNGAASDADLDVAMALIMAKCKWGAGYDAEATRVINAIKASEIQWDGAVSVLKGGDSAFFSNNGCVNYSYFSPAYYRAYAQQVPGDAAFWNQLASDTYVLLGRATNATTGLVRNWGATSGGSASGCNFAYSDDFGDDASRAPWRIATDYLWWGTADAKAWSNKIATWANGQGAANVGQWYHLDGTFDTSHPGYNNHTAITMGPLATSASTLDQATANVFAGELLKIPHGTGTYDDEYFPLMLRALSMLYLSGHFTTCGGP